MTEDPHRDGLLLKEGVQLSEAIGAVILLHGRGASAEDILGLRQAFYVPGVIYLAPQAAGHTWYPQSFMAPIETNQPYLNSALARIDTIVNTVQDSGVPAERIVICGFSQGACLSTEFVARFPKRYGGLISFTGGLIGAPGSNLKYNGSLDSMPAFLGSGDPDPHVPWTRVEESAAVLTAMGAQVTKRRYPGRYHVISEEEVSEAQKLIQSVFGRA
jgi:predicted esterase